MRATSAAAIVTFSKVLFQKFLGHNYVKVSSHELWGTLTAAFWRTRYGWRFYRHGSRYVVIFYQGSSKYEGAMKIINRKKNATPHLKKHCTIIDDISRVVIRSCFSETSLVCDSNPVFIDILDSLFHSLFHFYLLFFTFIFTFTSSSNASTLFL